MGCQQSVPVETSSRSAAGAGASPSVASSAQKPSTENHKPPLHPHRRLAGTNTQLFCNFCIAVLQFSYSLTDIFVKQQLTTQKNLKTLLHERPQLLTVRTTLIRIVVAWPPMQAVHQLQTTIAPKMDRLGRPVVVATVATEAPMA
jgi:hypothetical protein